MILSESILVRQYGLNENGKIVISKADGMPMLSENELAMLITMVTEILENEKHSYYEETVM